MPIVVLLCTLLAQSLWSADSWEKKSYSEWTESEALKILQDSHWSKLSFVWASAEILAAKTEPGSATGEVHIEEHSSCCRTFTRMVDGASTESSPLDTSTPEGAVAARRILSYRVLLYSSTRVRQALVRVSQLRGSTWDLQAEAPLDRPMEDLVVAVAGPDMQPFENTSAEALAGSAYLRSRKGKREKAELKDFVPPGMRPDGLALFVFSRKAGGKPIFDAADDLIEFGAGEGAFKIRASFKVEKLLVNGAPDF